jgi:leader peptidase (prepilin peptidase) / N-methyltransferase
MVSPLGAWMILIPTPQLLVRWRAVMSRTAAVMRTADTIAFVAAGACSAAASVVLAPDWRGMAGAGLAALMFAIAAVDARRFIIPDELTAAALALGLIHAAIGEIDAVAEALVLSAVRGVVLALAFLGLRAVYRRLRGRQGIGLGDVKLAGVAGAWLDWSVIPIAIEIAAVAALGTYLIRHLWFRRALRPTTRLPFGLFLAPAIWIGWLLETTLLLYPTASSF